MNTHKEAHHTMLLKHSDKIIFKGVRGKKTSRYFAYKGAKNYS